MVIQSYSSLRDFRQKIVAIQKNNQKKIKKKLIFFINSVDTFFNKVYIHYHRRTTQQRRSFLTKQGSKEAIEQVRLY